MVKISEHKYRKMSNIIGYEEKRRGDSNTKDKSRKQYKYLGAIFDTKRKINQEIKNR